MRQVIKAVIGGLVLMVAAWLTAGCSGGKEKSNFYGPAGMTTATVTGSVNQATFVVVDAGTNAEVGRVASSGALGDKSFSFPLSLNHTFKFYLIENDGTANARLFPVYVGGKNRFTVSTVTQFDLGFISTATGTAVPANDPAGVAGVADSGTDASIPATLAPTAFTTADLSGNWRVLQLTSGIDAGWQTSTVSIDATGLAAAASYQSNSGSGTTPSVLYSMAPSGVVTFPGGVIDGFQGVMTKDKGMMVGTISAPAGDYTMTVMVRVGAGFAQGDLKGNWAFSNLEVGAAPAYVHGDATVDASGNLSVVDVYRSGGSGSTASPVLSVDPTGVVTNSASSNFYGVLTADKNLLVAVDSTTSGPPYLTILNRTDATVGFSGGDLRGSWRTNWLSAGGTPSAANYGRAVLVSDGLVCDEYGNIGARLTAIELGRVTQADFPLSVAMGATGRVGFKNSDFYGTISLGKNLLIGTMTETNSNLSIYLFVK